MDIYNSLSKAKPQVTAGVSIDSIGDLLKRGFAGLLSTADGRFAMPNEIGRLLLQINCEGAIQRRSGLCRFATDGTGQRLEKLDGGLCSTHVDMSWSLDSLILLPELYSSLVVSAYLVGALSRI